MIADTLRARFSATRDPDARRAVIDIGSNTVRLVIYGGPPRAPEVLWNEKVSARLGRDLEKNGAMPAAAMDEALAALARFALLVRDLGIEQVETVATAAPRDATNGAEFIVRVAELGLPVRVLSGEEEARASAYGAIGAFPGAHGVVADLGGGSLELVTVRDGECDVGASFPLGTLRLPALRATGRFDRKVTKLLKGAKGDIAHARGEPLYMIGGTWRAFATYAMSFAGHPLTDPHAFTMTAEEATEVAQRVRRRKPAQIAQVRGISTMRSEKLPDASALLIVLLRQLAPEALVFSSWGLREGLHFHRLGPDQRDDDPLLAGVAAFVGERDGDFASAAAVVQWTASAALSAGPRMDMLRTAAAQLTGALHRVEPNLRGAQALEWALDKRWIGIDHAGRAMLAAALRASLGTTDPHERLTPLASEGEIREATAWGLAFRLAQRLGAGSAAALQRAQLGISGGELVLEFRPDRAALAFGPVAKDLTALASWLGLQPRIIA